MNIAPRCNHYEMTTLVVDPSMLGKVSHKSPGQWSYFASTGGHPKEKGTRGGHCKVTSQLVTQLVILVAISFPNCDASYDPRGLSAATRLARLAGLPASGVQCKNCW